MPVLLALLPVWNVAKAAIGGVVSFLTTKPGVYFLAAALVAGAVWYNGHRGFHHGVAQEKADEALRLARATAAAEKQGRLLQAQIDRGLAGAADRAGFLRGQAQARTITITKEVPHYVTVQTDRDFPLPCGLVRLHDAAALGADPASLGNPAALADGAACPVKASDLASIIVENYGLDHEKDAQIIGLQDLARSLKAALEGSSAP